jgi:hypothetical protein
MARAHRQQKEYKVWPGSSAWERWESSGDGHWHCISTMDKPDADGVVWDCVGVPSAGLVWMPLSLVGDAALFVDMAKAHLERCGLLVEGSASQALCVRAVAEQAQGHLGAVVLWPEDAAAIGGQSVGRHFVPSACGKECGDSDIFIWLELGEWVVGFYRLGQPLYVKGLGDASDPESCASDILCELLHLHGAGWLDWPKRVGVESTSGESLGRAVAARVGAGLHVHPHKAPRLVGAEWNITPARVLELRAKQAKRRIVRRIVAVGVVLLLIALGAGTGHRAWIEWQTMQVRRDMEQGMQRVAELRDIALRWETLEPTFDTSRYPLEILRFCVLALPKEGARLNLFQMEDRRILLRGEARGAKDAFDFADALKKNNALKHINWQMPQPKLLPNDTAQFQLEGSW